MINGPTTVAIFMDGNRRWAKAHGLSVKEGHTAGKDVFKRFIDFYPRIRKQWGTKHYIFYAFSTENWNRSAEEVAALMGIFDKAFDEFREHLDDVIAADLRIVFIGQRDVLSASLQKKMAALERDTAQCSGTLALAISYGGRADIVQAAQSLAEEGVEISEASIGKRLWTRNLPEVDLIIRPGGERRLSNFLLWNSAYSELFFTDTLWPDFGEKELEKIFEDYASRERRRGK